MLQVVLFLIAIGITLFLWQAFPAFKWVFACLIIFVVATFIALTYFLSPHLLGIEKNKASSKTEQTAPFADLWGQKQELVIPPPHQMTEQEWADKATRQQALDKAMGRTGY